MDRENASVVKRKIRAVIVMLFVVKDAKTVVKNFATSLYWFIKNLQATAIELYDKETKYQCVQANQVQRIVVFGCVK